MNSDQSSTISTLNWKPVSRARHPALIAACCLATGVLFGDSTDIDSGTLLVTTLLFGIVALILVRSRTPSFRVAGAFAAALTLLAFGSWRISFENAGRPSESLRALTDSGDKCEVFAQVDGIPYQKSSGWRVPLKLITVKGVAGDVPVNGRVLMTSVLSLQGLGYGDYVRFEGRAFSPTVRRNPGGFDYAEYLHRQGFDATIRPESQLTHWPQGDRWAILNLVEPVRRWIRGTFAEHLEDTPQSLLLGLLLGDTDRLPKPVSDAFRESGTSHLLAVSGANVWLVVGMILLPMYIFSIPRWPRTLVALTVIVFFSFLTRNEPSVVRASLMVGLILVGQLLWRPVAPLNAVGAAGMIIILFSPSHVFRPGFQLSFAAVIGILIAVGRVAPRLKGVWRKKLPYTAVMFVVASVAATVATAPVSAWHFGTAPVAGVLSNLVMVPLAGVAAHLGLLILALDPISSVAAGGVAWLAGYLLNFSAHVAEFFASMPSAMLSWSRPSVLVLIHLAGAAVLLLSWRHRYRWFRPLVYYLTMAVVILAVLRLRSDNPSTPSISLLDTGRQRVAVVSPDGQSAGGIVDDPGIDEDLDQWVIQPFLRHEFGYPRLDKWDSWRRLSQDSAPSRTGKPVESVWRRFYSIDDADSAGMPRIWADSWKIAGSQLVMFRDVPEIPVDRFLQLAELDSTLSIVVLPAQARTEWLRQVIDSTHPETVVLYGKSRFSKSPEESLAFWRLRFPRITFYSSAVHGGLTLELLPNRVKIRATVREQSPLGG